MGTVFLFDSPHARRPGRVDVFGIVLMILGFGALQLMLDWGEREDWFDSELIRALWWRPSPASRPSSSAS